MNRSEDARRCESSNQDEKLSHYEVIKISTHTLNLYLFFLKIQ